MAIDKRCRIQCKNNYILGNQCPKHFTTFSDAAIFITQTSSLNQTPNLLLSHGLADTNSKTARRNKNLIHSTSNRLKQIVHRDTGYHIQSLSLESLHGEPRSACKLQQHIVPNWYLVPVPVPIPWKGKITICTPLLVSRSNVN